MTPEHEDSILTRLIRMEGKHDSFSEKTSDDLKHIKNEVHRTNGRVSQLELNEIARNAARAEHDRMERELAKKADKHEHRVEKWIGIGPVVIASVISGSVVVVFSLILTGSI